MLQSCLPLLPACFCWNRERKIEASHFGRSLSSRLFKHNKMYINSSPWQIRGNKGTYGGVVLGQRRNKSCSKCADTFPIVLSCPPPIHTLIPGFHSASAAGWWCTVGEEIPLPLVLFVSNVPAHPPTLTWVPNCSLVGATTDLSPAFIQIYHN